MLRETRSPAVVIAVAGLTSPLGSRIAAGILELYRLGAPQENNAR
jgi:hypothetical protein